MPAMRVLSRKSVPAPRSAADNGAVLARNTGMTDSSLKLPKANSRVVKRSSMEPECPKRRARPVTMAPAARASAVASWCWKSSAPTTDATVGSLWLATSITPAREASRANAKEHARRTSGTGALAVRRPVRSAVESNCALWATSVSVPRNSKSSAAASAKGEASATSSAVIP